MDEVDKGALGVHTFRALSLNPALAYNRILAPTPMSLSGSDVLVIQNSLKRRMSKSMARMEAAEAEIRAAVDAYFARVRSELSSEYTSRMGVLDARLSSGTEAEEAAAYCVRKAPVCAPSLVSLWIPCALLGSTKCSA